MHKYELILENRLKSLEEIFSSTDLVKQFSILVSIVKETLKNENKILVCGNGGSAAAAMHFSGELVGRFRINRCPFPVLTLNCDVASMTAIANDYSYNDVFSRQVEAFAKKGDLLFVLTTSGNSMNVLKALEYANKHNISTCGLIGKSGGQAIKLLHYPVHINTVDTAIIQEVQQILIHIICSEIDADLEYLVQ